MTELLKAEDLTIEYETEAESIVAVSNANFTIEEGEYYGLVGESGCGKSTIANSIVGALDENGDVTSGKLWYKGDQIQHLSDKELNEKVRWSEISLIPQSSMNSLDPLQRISKQASEVASVHTDMTDEEAVDRLRELFDIVGLNESRVSDYPHQFSGGMQQRAIIALSLLLEPSLVIADEPTTALDVIMQDQVFKYLMRIRQQTDTSMLLITHDISLVFESCDKMAIMHSGQIAESGSVETVFDDPRHPYSVLLQRAFPDVRYPNRELEVIEGTPPQNTDEISYCTFTERCPWAVEECSQHAPELDSVGSDEGDPGSHRAACFRKEEMSQLREENLKSVTDGGVNDDE